MLSRPDNADITQYQQYRHSLAAKYSGTEGAKLERQKSAPGTSGELQTVDQSANKVHRAAAAARGTVAAAVSCCSKS